MTPRPYVRRMRNVGHGLFLVRDFAMDGSMEAVPERIVDIASQNATHTIVQIVYKHAGPDVVEKPYAIAHPGIPPIPGYEVVFEVQYIPQN